jgi:hypothetical protein
VRAVLRRTKNKSRGAALRLAELGVVRAASSRLIALPAAQASCQIPGSEVALAVSMLARTSSSRNIPSGVRRAWWSSAAAASRAARAGSPVAAAIPAKQNTASATALLSPISDAVEKLGWSDMKLIFATHFADEIAAVTEEGGVSLLRERVAALDTDQRQVLREALDEVTIASWG